jgi:hypothetical protein
MDPTTVTPATVTVTGPGGAPVIGTVTNVGRMFIFHPNSGTLEGNTRYTVKVSTGAEDLAGNGLVSDYSWSFTTGTAPDVTGPTVTLTDPPAGATGVATSTRIAAVFSETMDPTTVTVATVRVTGPGTTPVVGTVTNVGRVFTFNPVSGTLAGNTRYTVAISTGAEDLAGNALAGNYI